MAFQIRSHLLHLPRKQQRAGGWLLLCFYAVRVTTTSLACNSKLEVVFTPFRQCLYHHHLPHMQK